MAIRRPDESERLCLVTREAKPPAGLLRFVADPDGNVIPDIRGKLPGRGVWVTGSREMVETAVKRRLFGRGLKAEVTVGPEIADLVDRLLTDAALSALSMARKAGRVVTGFGKVTEALTRGSAVAIVHALEAAPDGRRKVGQALRRRRRGLEEIGEPAEMPVKVIGSLFAGAELDLALGGANVIHAALLAGGASSSFLNSAAALARYRGGRPEIDWMADAADDHMSDDPPHDGPSDDERT